MSFSFDTQSECTALITVDLAQYEIFLQKFVMSGKGDIIIKYSLLFRTVIIFRTGHEIV